MLTADNRNKREEINIPRKILPSSLHYYGPKYEVLRLKPLSDECLSSSSNLKWPKVDSSYSYFLPWVGDLLTHQSALFQSTFCLFIPAGGTAGESSLILSFSLTSCQLSLKSRSYLFISFLPQCPCLGVKSFLASPFRMSS